MFSKFMCLFLLAQVFLNNFRRVPGLCQREEGESSRELFEKVRVNAVFFEYCWILGGFLRLCKCLSFLGFAGEFCRDVPGP